MRDKNPPGRRLAIILRVVLQIHEEGKKEGVRLGDFNQNLRSRDPFRVNGYYGVEKKNNQFFGSVYHTSYRGSGEFKGE